MNGDPLRVGDPTTLGAFTIHSRLMEHAAGTVFSGRDPEGQQVAVVVLHAPAAADSAVRDRLEAAITGFAQQGKVRDASPRGPLAWAALAYDPVGGVGGAGAGVSDAARLLDAAGLTSTAQPDVDGGPAFAPHWSGGSAAGWQGQAWSGAPNQPSHGAPLPVGPGAPAGGTAAPSRTPLVAGLAGATVLLVLVVAACVVVIARSGGDPPEPRPVASGPTTPSTATETSPAATPTATPNGSKLPPKAKNGRPGPVSGPTYARGEDTYHMDLAGMPFEFEAPGTWGCMRRDQAPFSSRWICVDEGGTFPPKGSGAGGLVAVQPCPAPCGAGDRKTLLQQIVVDADDWRKTDSTTMYAEILGEDSKGKKAVRVAMSHVFAASGSGTPDTAVAVQLTGPPDQKVPMQKLINEIRERTP